MLDRLRGPLSEIHGAHVVPFAPPAVQGLGQFGGFPFELEDQSGVIDSNDARSYRRTH